MIVIQATVLQTKLSSCAHQSSAKHWRTVNEPLHADSTDRTRTDEEKSSLCRSFSDYSVSKINDPKSSIAAKISAILTPQFFQTLPTLALFSETFLRSVPLKSTEFSRPIQLKHLPLTVSHPPSLRLVQTFSLNS